MLAPVLRRVLFQPPSQSFILPPAFLLPWRARLSTVTNTISPTFLAFQLKKAPPTARSAASPPFRTAEQRFMLRPSFISKLKRAAPPPALPPAPALQPPLLLTSLAAQPPHYIITHIHARRYLLTAGDMLRLPFHLPDASIGTVLRLNRASVLGSRDYSYRGAPWVNERFFVCRMRVMGVEGEPMRVEEKTKRRQRHVKRVKSKMRFTILRCIELRVLGSGKGEKEIDEERGSEQEQAV